MSKWNEAEFELVVSEPLLAEYEEVLLYERVASRHGMSPDEVSDLMAALRQSAILVEPQAVGLEIPEDPDDVMVVECAVAGSADYVVSGDHHLLHLLEFRGIPILSPQQFLAGLEEGANQE